MSDIMTRFISYRVSIRRVALATVGAVAVVLAALWHYGVLASFMPRPPANAIMVIAPYRYHGTWVFDDPRAGLVREPFVGGVPEMIDFLVKDIPDAQKGFRLTFSAREFPGYQKKLTWVRGDSTGNWYRTEDPPMEGWLCPALFKYYREAPKDLYVKAEAKQ
ncbi:MAG: DUF6717 family protein [Thermoguttaceae bacterium]